MESLRCALLRPREDHSFHIVSSERNAGEWAIRCLDSVYLQRYDRSLLRHIFIDDASDDGTHEAILRWLSEHPEHRVEYIRNNERLGGTVNNLTGFRMAAPESVVVELNGDDWLPDPGVLRFLNRVYANEDVWMTYNTPLRFRNGHYRSPRSFWAPWPRAVVKANRFREATWRCDHLHTFRARLLQHVREENLIDPQTGQYWANLDDQALYLSMFELAGRRARHIYRVTCVYNSTEWSESRSGAPELEDIHRRIRQLPKHAPLDCL